MMNEQNIAFPLYRYSWINDLTKNERFFAKVNDVPRENGDRPIQQVAYNFSEGFHLFARHVSNECFPCTNVDAGQFSQEMNVCVYYGLIHYYKCFILRRRLTLIAF